MAKTNQTHTSYHNIYSPYSLDKIGDMAQKTIAGRTHIHTSLKDPVSAITHMVGAAMAAIGTFPLVGKAALSGSITAVAAMSIFMISMILLYTASSVYHSIDHSDKFNLLLRRIDHAMIFVLIAGSYTPVCLLVLPESRGIPLLIAVWSIAGLGIILKIWILRCPKWVSSVIYIMMGWLCILVFGPLLHSLSREGFAWLLAGGLIYTVGGIICGIKPKIFHRLPQGFGNHEIFHLFVMAGSLCHFIFMYRCVL